VRGHVRRPRPISETLIYTVKTSLPALLLSLELTLLQLLCPKFAPEMIDDNSADMFSKSHSFLIQSRSKLLAHCVFFPHRPKFQNMHASLYQRVVDTGNVFTWASKDAADAGVMGASTIQRNERVSVAGERFGGVFAELLLSATATEISGEFTPFRDCSRRRLDCGWIFPCRFDRVISREASEGRRHAH